MDYGKLLLRAILQTPADTTARLVYADWLQGEGREDRAEFIRVQCEIAQLEAQGVFVDGGSELAERELQLWERVATDMGRELENCAGQRLPLELLRDTDRGFVCHVEVPTAEFLEFGPQLFTVAPITEVSLVDKGRLPTTSQMFFGRWDNYSEYDYNLVPSSLFDRLKGLERRLGTYGMNHLPRQVLVINAVMYDSLVEAEQDLSQACVQWGRERAGLG